LNGPDRTDTSLSVKPEIDESKHHQQEDVPSGALFVSEIRRQRKGRNQDKYIHVFPHHGPWRRCEQIGTHITRFKIGLRKALLNLGENQNGTEECQSHKKDLQPFQFFILPDIFRSHLP
jgi:hypothetical protein